ncbi:hypothetical protein CF327_g577 [Tilletia walkeri]|uniref:Uncharacterized protein n=2 Tax=Tilletia TaxID=13289 RepID=A0A8X7NFU0_9BASI|nr:hypothetical protein CF327_g577 [Tilletia walkeri]KAE8231314.1 hypothetical protein CF326_g3680 [Tilletia indica]KAE8245073.1 hypothetical protein A4X13_0g6100 [Tilletia indica]KAE8271625.1 hypothetical protein A4X09_0g744 [Tilletia walkeri]
MVHLNSSLSFLLVAFSAGVIVSASASDPITRPAAHHRDVVRRKEGFERRSANAVRSIADPQDGDAIKAIPAPKIISECQESCVYITAPADANLQWELIPAKNFSVDANTWAYPYQPGMTNAVGISTDTYLSAIVFSYEKTSDIIYYTEGGDNIEHSLLARFAGHTKAWVGPQKDAPYSNVADTPTDDNIFIRYV